MKSLVLTAGSTWGEPLSYMEEGPPDRIIPLGFQVRSASLVVQGSISAYILRPRRRRRIRWLVWLPKTNTTKKNKTTNQNHQNDGPFNNTVHNLKATLLIVWG